MLKDIKGNTVNLGDKWTFRSKDYILKEFENKLVFVRIDAENPAFWLDGNVSNLGLLKKNDLNDEKLYELTIETLSSSEENFKVTKNEWENIEDEFQTARFVLLSKDGLIRWINVDHVTEFNISDEVLND